MNAIRERLAAVRPTLFEPGARTRQAAVAVILRARPHSGSGATSARASGDASGTDILFIQRAEKTGDPWSGHMAFPGGHLDPEDADLRAAAERETLEEIGLDLGSAEYLGALDHQRAQPRGRTIDMLIAPHVFAIEGDPVCTPNHEVKEVVWASLDELASNRRHDTETRPMAGRPTVFNGYRLPRGHFVWGLTYRMLKDFFLTLDPGWTPPPER